MTKRAILIFPDFLFLKIEDPRSHPNLAKQDWDGIGTNALMRITFLYLGHHFVVFGKRM